MILLTGASGFIGKHLLRSLVDKYGRENIVAFTSSPISNYRYLLHNGYNFNNNFFIENKVADIDTIIHAGAFTPKSKSAINNIDQCNSNILSTSRLITSKLPNLRKIIYLSSLDVYNCQGIITETSSLSPHSLYGQSKLYCENLITTYSTQKNIKNQILRIGHVYGPGEEKYQKLIPLTMNRLLNDEILQIHGNVNDLRSYIYISDVVKSILESLKLDNYVGVINIVGSDQIRIIDLIKKIIAISKKNPIIEQDDYDMESINMVFDNSKMKDYVFNPQIGIDEGLKEEWEYMEKFYS